MNICSNISSTSDRKRIIFLNFLLLLSIFHFALSMFLIARIWEFEGSFIVGWIFFGLGMIFSLIRYRYKYNEVNIYHTLSGVTINQNLNENV